MSLKNNEKPPSKLTVRLFGLTDEFMSLIPDGKKSLFLNQLITDSILSDRVLQSLVVVFGQKEGQKIHKKVEKLTKGVDIDSDKNLFEGKTLPSQQAPQIKEEISEELTTTINEIAVENELGDNDFGAFSIDNNTEVSKKEEEVAGDLSGEVKYNFDD